MNHCQPTRANPQDKTAADPADVIAASQWWENTSASFCLAIATPEGSAGSDCIGVTDVYSYKNQNEMTKKYNSRSPTVLVPHI